jgi:hypothetical protein
VQGGRAASHRTTRSQAPQPHLAVRACVRACVRVHAPPDGSEWVPRGVAAAAAGISDRTILSSLAAVQSVPAVSIMSSTMMQSHPLTWPTRSIVPITPACLRCLMIIASAASTPRASSPTTSHVHGVWRPFVTKTRRRYTKPAKFMNSVPNMTSSGKGG